MWRLRPSDSEDKMNAQSEFRSSNGAQIGIIDTAKYGRRAVKYSDINGIAIFEGDIVLGTTEQMNQRLRRIRDGVEALGTAIKGNQYRWPGAKVPYLIDDGLPDQDRVTQAIQNWEQNTKIRFVQRTTETDYVVFQAGDGCSSQVGRRGGAQAITLGQECTAGNAIHEIGHTIGLWHEQSREDRDAFIQIDWTNILDGYEHNFDQHIADGDDIGRYDYGSIMHYPAFAFVKDPSKPTIIVPNNVSVGQRIALSTGDISAANTLYP
jgi:hypothetical protein